MTDTAKQKKYQYAHLWLSCLFFAVSLACPAFYVQSMHQPVPSLGLLMRGWLGPLGGHFSWFANCFFIIAILLNETPKSSLKYGIISSLLALSFLGYDNIIMGSSGVGSHISGYGWGYFLWVLSITCFTGGQWIHVRFKRTKTYHSKTILRFLLFFTIPIILFAGYFFFLKKY